jgi:hypothetical protein
MSATFHSEFMLQNFLILFLVLFCNFSVLSQEPSNSCAAEIEIQSGTGFVVDTGKEGIYIAQLRTSLENRTVTYKWSVNGGKILDGQDTNRIKLLRENDLLYLFVEARISPDGCVIQTTYGHNIDRTTPILIKEYDYIEPDEEKGFLDGFFSRLMVTPDSRGTIYLRDDKNLKLRLKFLLNYMQQKKIDSRRITFLIGRDRDSKTYLYLLTPTSNKPYCRECTEVEASDTKALQEIFRLKLKTF